MSCVTARLFALGVGSMLSLALAVTAVSAQTPGQVKPPGTAQPGQVERQFERPPEPSAKQGVITIPAPGQTPPPNAEGIKFVLDQLTIEGGTVYPADDLRRVYAGVLRREVTLADIYRVVDALTARYRNDGYILSQVIVPAQSVEGGAVRLQAIEGYIADVRVEGGSASMRDRVRAYGDKIRGHRPLTAGVLERYVLLMNDLPGVQVRAVLAPANTPGASDLVLQVSPRSRVAAGFSSDNRGSKAQGMQRVFTDVEFRNLAGASLTELRDVTTFTPELTYVALSHDQFVGAQGGKFGVAASYVYSRPQELAIVPLELTTKSETVTLSYTFPLMRRRARNLYVRGTLSALDSRSKIFGIKDATDRLRAARLSLTYDASDGLNGVNIADLEYSHGISGLGSSVNGDQYLSRPSGRTDFQKLTLYAARIQSLPAGWSVLLAANGQYALTDLLAPELFSVGGEQFGRGYDASELLNDHGAAVRIDLRHTHTWGGRRPATLTTYGFADGGRVWQRTRFPGLDAQETATSAGGGFRFGVGSQVSAFVEFAKPLDRIVGQENNRAGRVFAGITVH
jgi:hemolysin activation/secretion protein